MLRTIRKQAEDLLTEVTARPKPTYKVDGLDVAWRDYVEQLRKTIAWCDRQIERETEVQLEPVVLCDGEIIDGHHRHVAQT